MLIATYKGIVKGNTILLEEGAELPDGAEVVVTPLAPDRGSAQAILAAMDASPHLKPGDVQEFRRLIEEGRQPARYEDPFNHAQKKRKRRK